MEAYGNSGAVLIWVVFRTRYYVVYWNVFWSKAF